MLRRLSTHWPLLFAAVFCLYAVLLLGNAYRSQQQLRQEASGRLLADNQRRVALLEDFIGERKNGAQELAESPEIETYLVNRDLGMSLRYGLNTSLDAIEQRFRRYVAQKTLRGEAIYQRIIFYDSTGANLADLTPGEADIPLPARPEAPSLHLDIASRRLISTAPVLHKGQLAGTLVTLSDLGQLQRYLLGHPEHRNYRELLLGADGRELAIPGQPPQLSLALAQQLAALPADSVSPVSARLAGKEGEVDIDFALRTPINGQPLALVTLLSDEELYGQITSRLFLFSAGLFSLLILGAALLYERMRQRAHQLQADVAESDRHRVVLQGENAALSEEIARRE
ncbi:MAG: hypothetical protein RIR00_511, partial [Pseudomonadota bacterium]